MKEFSFNGITDKTSDLLIEDPKAMLKAWITTEKEANEIKLKYERPKTSLGYDQSKRKHGEKDNDVEEDMKLALEVLGKNKNTTCLSSDLRHAKVQKMRDERKGAAQPTSNHSPLITNYKPAVTVKNESVVRGSQEINKSKGYASGSKSNNETPQSVRHTSGSKFDNEEKKISNVYSLKKENKTLVPLRAASSDKRPDKLKREILNTSFEELQKNRKTLELQARMMELETSKVQDLLAKDAKNQRLQKDKSEFNKALENLKREKAKAENNYNNYRVTKLLSKITAYTNGKNAILKKSVFTKLKMTLESDTKIVQKNQENRQIYVKRICFITWHDWVEDLKSKKEKDQVQQLLSEKIKEERSLKKANQHYEKFLKKSLIQLLKKFLQKRRLERQLEKEQDSLKEKINSFMKELKSNLNVSPATLEGPEPNCASERKTPSGPSKKDANATPEKGKSSECKSARSPLSEKNTYKQSAPSLKSPQKKPNPLKCPNSKVSDQSEAKKESLISKGDSAIKNAGAPEAQTKLNDEKESGQPEFPLELAGICENQSIRQTERIIEDNNANEEFIRSAERERNVEIEEASEEKKVSNSNERINERESSPNNIEEGKGNKKKDDSKKKKPTKDELELREKERREKKEQIKKMHEDKKKQKEEEMKKRKEHELEELKLKKQLEKKKLEEKRQEELENKLKKEKEQIELKKNAQIAKDHHIRSQLKFYGFRPWKKFHCILKNKEAGALKVRFKFQLKLALKMWRGLVQEKKKKNEILEEKLYQQAAKHRRKKLLAIGFNQILQNYIESFEEHKILENHRESFLKRMSFRKWVTARPVLREKKIKKDRQYDDIITRFRKVILLDRALRVWRDHFTERKREDFKAKHKKIMWNKVNKWLDEIGDKKGQKNNHPQPPKK